MTSSSLFTRYREGSNPLRAERRVELALLCALLLLLLAFLYAGARVMMSNRVSTITPAADSLRIASLQRGADTSSQDSLLLRARPIFWEGRQPLESEGALALQEAVSEGESGASEKIKKLELLGIYGAGTEGGAIVTVDDRQQRLAVGDSIKGWTLAEIAPDRAIFVSGAARDERVLIPRSPDASAAAAAGNAAGANRRKQSAVRRPVRVQREAVNPAVNDLRASSRSLGVGGN